MEKWYWKYPNGLIYAYDISVDPVKNANPAPVQTTKAEYDAYVLKTKTLPTLAQDNIYQSVHKVAEILINLSPVVQILEHLVKYEHLRGDSTKLDIGDLAQYNLSYANVGHILDYLKEEIKVAVERQNTYKKDIENGVEASKAYTHILGIKVPDSKDITSGKNLAQAYLKGILGTDVYNTWIKDNTDVNYTTSVTEDESE